jgi:hypothetical protein
MRGLFEAFGNVAAKMQFISREYFLNQLSHSEEIRQLFASVPERVPDQVQPQDAQVHGKYESRKINVR